MSLSNLVELWHTTVTNDLPNEPPLSRQKFDLMTFQVKSEGTTQEDVTPGTKVRLHFNGGMVTGRGEEIELLGSLDLLSSPNNVDKQDMEVKNHENAQDQLKEWLQGAGLTEDDKLFTKVIAAQIPLKAAFLTPGMELENVKEMLLFQLLSVILDDTFEKYKTSKLNFDDLTDAMNVICAICLGDDYDKDFGETGLFPNFGILVSLFSKLRGMAETRGIESSQNLIWDLVEYIEARAWEMDEWWKDCASDASHPREFYFLRKELTHGLKIAIEVACIYKEIHINAKVRRDPLFNILERQWMQICITVEAILTLQKSIQDNERDNCVLMRLRKKTLKQALETTFRTLESNIQDMRSFEGQLNIKFSGTESFEPLQKFYVVGKRLVDAQLQYLFASKVYGDFKVTVELIQEQTEDLDVKE